MTSKRIVRVVAIAALTLAGSALGADMPTGSPNQQAALDLLSMPSDVAIGKARRISTERDVQVNWVVADVARDELPDPGYDLVCVLYLHTDPAERERWLPRLIAAVKPGGTFLYIGHDPSNIEHGVGGPQKVDLLPGPDAMTEALSDFRMDRAETVERPVDNDPGHGRDLSGIALDTFVRAVRPR